MSRSDFQISAKRSVQSWNLMISEDKTTEDGAEEKESCKCLGNPIKSFINQKLDCDALVWHLLIPIVTPSSVSDPWQFRLIKDKWLCAKTKLMKIEIRKRKEKREKSRVAGGFFITPARFSLDVFCLDFNFDSNRNYWLMICIRVFHRLPPAGTLQTWLWFHNSPNCTLIVITRW